MLLAKPDPQGKIVKTELIFYCTTHKMGMLARPDLFKLNKITHQEHLKNLMILLTDNDYATASIADLPSNEDALTIIEGKIPFTELTANSSDIKINNTYMIAWHIENTWNWFVGYVKDKLSDNHYAKDHLEILKGGNSTVWKYPGIGDTQIIFNGQIIPVKV